MRSRVSKRESYNFPIKGSDSIGMLKLVGNPANINQAEARLVLVESFICEYEKYLTPSEINDSLTSWRDGDHSVRKYYEDYFATELQDFISGKFQYWVQATINGRLAGWATFERERSDPNAVYMNLLVVHPEFQGKGVGGQLVKALDNLREIPELSAIHLLLRRKNQGGRIFYSKLGFFTDPAYQRDDNFVDGSLLEGFTWKNPSLQHRLAILSQPMFPREFIESFLQGYSVDEIDAIKQDLSALIKFSFYRIPARRGSVFESPMYIATAGGPGAAKSTTLETFLRQNNLIGQVVYADPDAVSLRNMTYTYRQSLTYFDFATTSSNHAALKNAYDKWRGASNYITHEILQLAFDGEAGVDQKYAVAHGSTSTSPKIGTLYERIKARGYHITLLLCYSNDETRRQCIANREKEQGFVQCDPNDVVEKGKMFPERFDVYFQYADELFFFWNDELTHGQLPRPCAKFEKVDGVDARLTILDERAWVSFCRKYLRDVATLQIPVCPAFENLIPRELRTASGSVASALQTHGILGGANGGQQQQQQDSDLQRVLSA